MSLRTLTDVQVNALAIEALEIMYSMDDDSFAPSNAVRCLPCYDEITEADRMAINAVLYS